MTYSYQGRSAEMVAAQANKFERVLACEVIARAVADYRRGPGDTLKSTVRTLDYASAAMFLYSKTETYAELRNHYLSLVGFGDNLFEIMRRFDTTGRGPGFVVDGRIDGKKNRSWFVVRRSRIAA